MINTIYTIPQSQKLLPSATVGVVVPVIVGESMP
jgi:hypothetical protein